MSFRISLKDQMELKGRAIARVRRLCQRAQWHGCVTQETLPSFGQAMVVEIVCRSRGLAIHGRSASQFYLRLASYAG